MSQQSQGFQSPINLAVFDLPSSGGFFDFTGEVKLAIVGAVVKAATTNQANGMLELTLTVVEGEHAGERATYNLNIYNQNQEAARIAFQELAAFGTAVGADPVLSHPSQLLGKSPFFAHVSVTHSVSKTDPNKKYTNNRFVDFKYADGTPIKKGQFGAQGGQQQGYAQPGAAPVVPVAPAPVVPQQPQAPQGGYAQQAPQQAPAPQQPQAPQGYPAAPQGGFAAPQQQPQAPQAPQQPQGGFAPPAGAAPFMPPQQ